MYGPFFFLQCMLEGRIPKFEGQGHMSKVKVTRSRNLSNGVLNELSPQAA